MYLKNLVTSCWWECRSVHPLWKTVWGFLKKLKMELPFDPLLGIYPKKFKTQNTNLKDYMHSHINYSIVYNSQNMEATKCPSTEEWMKKLWYVYTMGWILLSHPKEWNHSICNSMDVSRRYVKWKKPDRGRPILYDIIYMWNMKNKTNKQNRNRLIDTEDRLMDTRGKVCWLYVGCAECKRVMRLEVLIGSYKIGTEI